MRPYSSVSGLLMSTDWVGLSVIFDDQLPHDAPPRHRWHVYDKGTNVWQYRAELYNEYGERVLTILAKPISTAFIDPHAGLVEVANEWLYHGIGVAGALDLLQWCCPFRITGFSRLDLCMDFQPSLEQVDVIKGLSSKRYYVAGKRNWSEFYSTPTDDYIPPVWRGGCPHCQSWGHKTTQVKWKLYYKSKELRDAGQGWFDKPYIVDGWRHYGLDENNVWRLEVSMHNCNSLLKDGEEISFARWSADDMGIFTSLYKSRFVVRRDEGHKDKTNDTVIPFLPISTSSTCRCKGYESETGRSARIGLLRSLVKYATQEEVFMDVRSSEALSEHVESIVMRDHLEDYFKSMTSMTLGQWTKQLVELREGNILNTKVLPKNTDFKPNTHFDIPPDKPMV